MTRAGRLGMVAALCVLPATATAQQTHLLVIAGLGGDATYRAQFHEWAETLVDAATATYEVPRDRIIYLGERPDVAPDLITDRSSSENIEAAFDTLATQTVAGDHVVVVLFGHGSFSDVARINLPGPDLSADDFAALVDRLAGRQVTFVNTASASGPFIEKLSGDRRTVMTATKTGGERNASVFGGYFVEAFADGHDEADQNRDERISMLEAFSYARQKVTQSYEADGKLLTEHALLDDNGDGTGTLDPNPLDGDGLVARTLFLTSGAALQSEMAFPDDPELRALYDERRELETRVEELQRLKEGADPAQYDEELERLLVELALKSRQIRQREAAKQDGEAAR